MSSDNVEIIVGARDDSRATFDALKKRLDDFKGKVAEAQLKVTDDQAKLELDLMKGRLDEFGRKTETAKLKVNFSSASSINNSLKRMEGVLSSTMETGITDGSSQGLSKLPGILGTIAENPEVSAGVAGIFVAAAPFIAQALGGAVIAGLGVGLAGLGAVAAMKLKGPQKAFKDFKDSANDDLKSIGRGFAPVMDNLFHVASSTFNKLTPVLTKAMKDMKPGLEAVTNELGKAFSSPAVQKSILAVANAFGAMMKALAPQLPGMIASIAGGITAIAKAVSKNPGTFAAFINFLVKLVADTLDVIAALTRVAAWVERQHDVWKALGAAWSLAWDILKKDFRVFLDYLTGIFKVWSDIFHGHWKSAFDDAKSLAAKLWHDIISIFTTEWDALNKLTGGKLNDLRHEIANIFDGVRHDIAHVWDQIFSNSIGSVIRIGHNVETQFNSLRHSTANIFDAVRHDIAHYWDLIWNNTIGRLKNGVHDAINWFDNMRHDISTRFTQIKHDVSVAWDNIWNGTVDRIKTGIKAAMGWIDGIPGKIRNALSGASHFLTSAGREVIQGLWDGMTVIWDKVKGWVSSLAGWIKNHKGPVSFDKQLLVPAGKALMSGLHSGLISGFASGPLGFIQGLAGTIGGLISGGISGLFGGGGKVGAGVAQWGGDVSKALAMLGLSPGLKGNVLYQMQTESGGNPRAINLTDINAQHGDPSKGLMQVILSTFNAYAGPFRALGQYNPFANIFAALNYAKHVYGPTLMRGGMGIGSGHGYAGGGITGGLALVGERGRELVRLPQGSTVIPHGTSENMMAGSGGAASIQLEIHSSGNPADEFIAQLIRKYVRVRGGNVQTVFGRA